jgi:mannitol-1-phosphate 5-dehydrogenase
VGLLAWQAGFEIVFVDKKPDLVAALQKTGCYQVKLYGRQCEQVAVSGFRVYHSGQRQEVVEEIADATLVLTAVFDHNLADVAQTLALAVSTCRRAGRQTPLNCIACENMMDSSSTLGRHVRHYLEAEDLGYCEEYVGFPDCMISRIVPRPEPDPLVMVAEDYNEWTARAESFKGEKPAGLTALELVDNQTARLERKLFIHNGGHAICGYLGFHRQRTYIHEAVADPVVAGHVVRALDELGEIVRCKHGFSAAAIEAYKEGFKRRGAVAELRDEVLRVVREPVRKLSSRERLVAPALLAEEYSLPRRWIVQGIVAALKYRHPADLQSLQLAEKLRQQGVAAVVEEVCGIRQGSALSAEIAQAWKDWQLS